MLHHGPSSACCTAETPSPKPKRQLMQRTQAWSQAMLEQHRGGKLDAAAFADRTITRRRTGGAPLTAAAAAAGGGGGGGGGDDGSGNAAAAAAGVELTRAGSGWRGQQEESGLTGAAAAAAAIGSGGARLGPAVANAALQSAGAFIPHSSSTPALPLPAPGAVGLPAMSQVSALLSEDDVCSLAGAFCWLAVVGSAVVGGSA